MIKPSLLSTFKVSWCVLPLLSVFQYLDVARSLEGYGTVTFPHCSCDARKNGHVVVTISLKNFRLQACTEEGDLQVSSSLLHARHGIFQWWAWTLLFCSPKNRTLTGKSWRRSRPKPKPWRSALNMSEERRNQDGLGYTLNTWVPLTSASANSTTKHYHRLLLPTFSSMRIMMEMMTTALRDPTSFCLFVDFQFRSTNTWTSASRE